MTSVTHPVRLSYRSQRWSGSRYSAPTTPNGDQTFTLNTSSLDTVDHEDRNRRWRDIIRSGGNATTDASGSKTFEINVTPGIIRATRTPRSTAGPTASSEKILTGGQLLWLIPQNLTNFSLDSSAVASNRGLTDLYSNLASVETAFKGFIFTGELRETLHMIRHPAQSLRKGISDYLGALKKRVPRRASRLRKRKIVADTWLEYSFGLQPFIKDCDDAIKAFYGSDCVHPIFEMVRGHGTERKILPGITINSQGGFINYHARTQQVESKTVKYYGIYQHSGQGVPDSHRYGFRLNEFVPTLWELMPYSFLVDYFTNIGDIISSWSYRSIGLSWCSRTTFQTVEIVSTDTWIDNPWGDPVQYDEKIEGNAGALSARRSKFVRTKSVSLGLPSLELQVPGFSSLKWVNIAALAVNLASARKHINP